MSRRYEWPKAGPDSYSPFTVVKDFFVLDVVN